jgi:uncharacterized protein YjbI with pentapeptide repeats
MTQEEQLKILEQGVEAWNQWREENPKVAIDLSRCNLSGSKLQGFNFAQANLSHANLRDTDLMGAKLIDAKLTGAKLMSANLQDADLNNVNLQDADLTGASLRWADLHFAELMGTNLSWAGLRGANLIGADLNKANLSNANLSGANLIGAKLYGIQGLGTNFTRAVLTGVCIQDWQIGSSTRLDQVWCDYVFCHWDRKNDEFTERLPIESDSIFKPGEFSQQFQILPTAQETIELIFTDGIDWQAFLASFQELRSQKPERNLGVQSMERQGATLIVRLDLEADKTEVETAFKTLYAHQIQQLEAGYEQELKRQGWNLAEVRGTIETERQEKATFMGILSTLAQNQQGPNYTPGNFS